MAKVIKTIHGFSEELLEREINEWLEERPWHKEVDRVTTATMDTHEPYIFLMVVATKKDGVEVPMFGVRVDKDRDLMEIVDPWTVQGPWGV